MFDASPSRLVSVFALRRGVRKDNFTRPTAARSAFKARCLFVRERVNSGARSLPNCLERAELKGGNWVFVRGRAMGRKTEIAFIDVLSLLKMLDGLDEQENMQGQGKCMHV